MAKEEADIFDRSFKKIILSLSPPALIRFINGLFGRDHPLNSEVNYLNTEHIGDNMKKRQADVIVSVAKQTYIIEEQTGADYNMSIRVFEYAYAQALREKKNEDGVIILPFPHVAVIYLEAGSAAPDTIEIRLIFPDGSVHGYAAKVVKLLGFGVDEIVEQGLSVLLPFCVMRIRKMVRQASTEEERLGVEAEIKELGIKLKEAIENCVERKLFNEVDAVTLLERLSGLINYIGKGYKTTEVKSMLKTSMMGYGQRLALKYERKGERRGERRGELRGRLEGERAGRLEIARKLKARNMPMEQIAECTGLSLEELANI